MELKVLLAKKLKTQVENGLVDDIRDILNGEDLSGCFSWEDTPQGFQFWLDLA